MSYLDKELSLNQWFSTCGSQPFHKGQMSDIYIMAHNTSKISYYVATKIILCSGHNCIKENCIKGLQHQEDWESVV